MLNQRRIERHQLPYYLKVFNRITDKPMGFIGNLSEKGLMLISPYPMLVNARFDMRLKIPGQGGRLRYVDFSATCQWTHEDVTPGSFDSGFALIAPSAEFVGMINALRHYFSFQPFVPSGSGSPSPAWREGDGYMETDRVGSDPAR
ncbi:PilZ domain-containing protein [Stutzerimonas nosocomialis]|uniref:PilZ domain-containing protein n=1 Tax=Stutzerimonas nosocomialis TaxID=1056496 RepID=A0A5R9QJH3_9GAMM|nr:PilZ domain-containing protein [Stutzerimonas nosocomialis]TLX54613.1 PilZ domain-containing protein [Stutzerimonas nosocomialis]TLX58402.1 PilZ domain-containing protein [Stutzerimonas nosocomialis]TLX65486.1 PilZ domain-containing protein [Stutzerimonas nosocomialis]